MKKINLYILCIIATVMMTNCRDDKKKPLVDIVFPENNYSVTIGEGITIVVNASDPDGLVNTVDFKIDNKSVFQSLTEPYEYAWITDNNTSLGSHMVTVIAKDNEGLYDSDSIVINVIEEYRPLTENEKLLTAHGWNASLYIENGIQHELKYFSEDDCWFFYPNHTYFYSLGSQMDPGPGGSYEENSSGTWELDENEGNLNWTQTKPANFQLSDLINLKSDTMILTIITSDYNRIMIYTNCH